MHGFRTFPEGGSDRWTVALHIFDGLSADSAPSATRYIQQLNVDIVPAAVAAFNTLHGCVLRLRQDGHSKVPRVDDRVIYENNLLPALIEWVLVWAMAAGICSVTETDVRVIAKPSKIRAYFRADVARALCMQRRAKWDSRAAAALVHGIECVYGLGSDELKMIHSSALAASYVAAPVDLEIREGLHSWAPPITRSSHGRVAVQKRGCRHWLYNHDVLRARVMIRFAMVLACRALPNITGSANVIPMP